MKRVGGGKRKTRHLQLKHYKERGKVPVSRYFQSFAKGDNVMFVLDSAILTGIFYRRFYGKSGVVQKMRGRCYEISCRDGGKDKTLIVHPIHLRRL